MATGGSGASVPAVDHHGGRAGDDARTTPTPPPTPTSPPPPPSSSSSAAVKVASGGTAPRTLVAAPVMLANGMEVAVHSVPRILARDLAAVLPGVPLEHLLIVTACQRARLDLVNVGADVAAEKDALLERFTAWAAGVKAAVAAHAPPDRAWVDYVDPCSGLPVATPNHHVIYPEVDTMELLLRYRTESAGPCKILLHPTWGSRVYPATLFSTAPAPVLSAALAAAGGGRAGGDSAAAAGAAGVPAP